MSLKQFSLLDTIKCKHYLARPSAKSTETGKNRGPSISGQSDDLRAFRWQGWGNTPKWEVTEKDLDPGPTGYHIDVTDTHSKSFSPSQCVTETPLRATSTLSALHSFILPSIHANSKEKYVFAPFVLNEEKTESRVDV